MCHSTVLCQGTDGLKLWPSENTKLVVDVILQLFAQLGPAMAQSICPQIKTSHTVNALAVFSLWWQMPSDLA